MNTNERELECGDRRLRRGKDSLIFFSLFSTVALIINKVQKDVRAISHLYNENSRFRIGTSFS